MSSENQGVPVESFLRAQIGAIVRRAVTRHCNVRSDAFFDLLQKELAPTKHAIVSTTPLGDEDFERVRDSVGLGDQELEELIAGLGSGGFEIVRKR